MFLTKTIVLGVGLSQRVGAMKPPSARRRLPADSPITLEDIFGKDNLPEFCTLFGNLYTARAALVRAKKKYEETSILYRHRGEKSEWITLESLLNDRIKRNLDISGGDYIDEPLFPIKHNIPLKTQQLWVAAIYFYTLNNPKIYRKLNEIGREPCEWKNVKTVKSSVGEFGYYSYYAGLLQGALQGLAKCTQTNISERTVYRGMNVTEYRDNLEIASFLFDPAKGKTGFMSTTADRSKIKPFLQLKKAGKCRIVQEFETTQGLDISKWSAYPHEAEVLISPQSHFRLVEFRIDDVDGKRIPVLKFKDLHDGKNSVISSEYMKKIQQDDEIVVINNIVSKIAECWDETETPDQKLKPLEKYPDQKKDSMENIQDQNREDSMENIQDQKMMLVTIPECWENIKDQQRDIDDIQDQNRD